MRSTSKSQGIIDEIASRHGVSRSAVEALFYALVASGGDSAQFNHPELGGFGQWQRGGMIMIGDMFNNGLKARVDDLCHEIAEKLRVISDEIKELPATADSSQSLDGQASFALTWWPEELGSPSSSGAQNDMRYACFPNRKRLAISKDGKVTLYDTGDYRLTGFSQQQSYGQSLVFSSQLGPISIDHLRVVEDADGNRSEQAKTVQPEKRPLHEIQAESAIKETSDPYQAIERLHDLFKKGVLSEDEFAAKKRDLLTRI